VSNRDEYKGDCIDLGLTPLQIRHYDDFLSIQDHFRNTKGLRNITGPDKAFKLGITPDSNGLEQWKYNNGDDLIFSAWGIIEPNSERVSWPDDVLIKVIVSIDEI